MNKEQQELVDKVYKNYILKKGSEIGDYGIKPILLTKEEFINKIKTDVEFSEKWGLTIEEQELSTAERKSIYEKEYTDGMEVPNNNWLNSKLTTRNIPTKVISVTYNGQTIESYENNAVDKWMKQWAELASKKVVPQEDFWIDTPVGSFKNPKFTPTESELDNEINLTIKYEEWVKVDRYIGLILDERSDDYTIGYNETSDLKKIKEWQQKMLGCTDIVDCKILKVEEII